MLDKDQIAAARSISSKNGRRSRCAASATSAHGKNALGDPCVALAWPANELRGLCVTLRAGEVVTTADPGRRSSCRGFWRAWEGIGGVRVGAARTPLSLRAPRFALVPRTQRSASSAVRCRAGAQSVALSRVALGPGSAPQRSSVAACPGHESERRRCTCSVVGYDLPTCARRSRCPRAHGWHLA